MSHTSSILNSYTSLSAFVVVMASEIEQLPDLSGFQKGDSPEVAAD